MFERKKLLSVCMVIVMVMGSLLVNGNNVNAAKKISLNITNITMSKGQSRKLKVSGAKKIKWKSSKKSIVSVSKKGKIKAKKKGTAVITATVNGKKYKCNVTINQPSKKKKDVLVVYFSQTGTTKSVAKKIKKLTGGDLFRIREKNKYPNDYDKTVERADKEVKQNARPAITTVAANMKSYDVVYVGFPIWWHTTPKVIDTFLEKYNLKGKTIIPFCTSGGSDIEEAMPAINDLCKGSTILKGYTADIGTTTEIREWLKNIGQL